jgi:hypothetical protein
MLQCVIIIINNQVMKKKSELIIITFYRILKFYLTVTNEKPSRKKMNGEDSHGK